MLEEITEKYSCDKNRIYVTGLSMGGYATWDLLEHYGNIFAAGIPICGGGNQGNAVAFKDIPIRIYHGTADPTVSFSASKNMYNAIIGAGGKKVEIIQLDGVGHNAWDAAFSDRDTFCWLFAQDKVKNPVGTYKYIPCFSICDNNEKIIIYDNDIIGISYITEDIKSNMVRVVLNLSPDSIKKLNDKFTNDNNIQYTVTWANQKISNFKLTKYIENNTFSMSGIFDYDSYLNFYKSIITIINE